jgi:hypothetical protein
MVSVVRALTGLGYDFSTDKVKLNLLGIDLGGIKAKNTISKVALAVIFGGAATIALAAIVSCPQLAFVGLGIAGIGVIVFGGNAAYHHFHPTKEERLAREKIDQLRKAIEEDKAKKKTIKAEILRDYPDVERLYLTSQKDLEKALNQGEDMDEALVKKLSSYHKAKKKLEISREKLAKNKEKS